MSDSDKTVTLPDRTWEPPLTTAVVVFALTGGAVAVTAVWANLRLPVIIGVSGAIAAALALRALTVHRYRVAAIAVAGVLFLPVGICLALAIAVAVLVRYRVTFPVASRADVVAPTLEIAAVAIIVIGASLAVFGASTRGDGLTQATLGDAVGILSKLLLVPVVWASSVGLLTVLASPEIPPNIDVLAQISDLLELASMVLLSPSTPSVAGTNGLAAELAIGTFALCLLLGIAGLRLLLSRLPITALLTDSATDVDRIEAQVEYVTSLLSAGRVIAIAMTLLLSGIDAVLTARQWREAIGPNVMDPLWAVATSGVLRQLTIQVYLVGLVVAVLVALIQRLARTSVEGVVIPYLPVAIGGAAVPGTYVVAPSIVPRGIDRIATYLSELGEPFRELTTGVVAFYGPGMVLTAVIVCLLFLTLIFMLAVYFTVQIGLMDDTTAGSTLAAVGLLVCAGFGAVTALPFAATVVVAVVGLAVGNLGAHGRGLGLEVGRLATTYRAEFVRLGFLSVAGILTAGVAIGVHRAIVTDFVTALPATLPLTLTLITIILFVILLWSR